jgi:hypothetical protein
VVHLGVGTNSSLALVSEEVIHGFTVSTWFTCRFQLVRTFNSFFLRLFFCWIEILTDPLFFWGVRFVWVRWALGPWRPMLPLFGGLSPFRAGGSGG